MLPENIKLRQSIWIALSELFLDTEITESTQKYIAKTILDSKFSPTEILEILWCEVFPVLCINLQEPAGQWAGFREDVLIDQINEYLKSGNPNYYEGLLSTESVYKITLNEWAKCCIYLPQSFSDCEQPKVEFKETSKKAINIFSSLNNFFSRKH